MPVGAFGVCWRHPSWIKGEVYTGPDGVMAKSSANGLRGTGFVSRYRL